MGEGLAAHVTNMYGSGEGNTVRHYYTGQKTKSKKKEGNKNGK